MQLNSHNVPMASIISRHRLHIVFSPFKHQICHSELSRHLHSATTLLSKIKMRLHLFFFSFLHLALTAPPPTPTDAQILVPNPSGIPAWSNPLPPLPTRWSYTFHSYTGNLPSGVVLFFILPGQYDGDYGDAKQQRSLRGRMEDSDDNDKLPSDASYRRSLAGARRDVHAMDQSLEERSCGGNQLDERLGCNPPTP